MREASALQANDIETSEPCTVAERKPKGNQVVLDSGETADERMGSDTNELMRRGAAAQNGEITDIAVAGQHHVVGQNNALANAAIMRNVGVGQEYRPRSDDRFRAAARGAGVHRHPFANEAALANHKADRLAAIFEVLRRMSNGGEGINHRARANAGVAGDTHMRDQPYAVIKLRSRSNLTKRPNLDARPEPSPVFDDGARMDCIRHSRTSIADTSASQTSTSSTFASPRNHHMFRFLAMRVM